MGKKKKNRKYVRIAVFGLDDVIPYVLTKELRHRLRMAGYSYGSKEWQSAGRRKYPAVIDGKPVMVPVSMGSHRYQLYAKKGTTCVNCGLVGTYFALERGVKDNPNKYHFNLYGIKENGDEMMLTKDHIIPKSKGGKNELDNYQPMCLKCNQKKADKLPCLK